MDVERIVETENHVERWKQIDDLLRDDPQEHQRLLAIEVALATQWRPPTREERIAAFATTAKGTQLAIHGENLYDMINPVRVIQGTKHLHLMYVRLGPVTPLPPAHLWTRLMLSQTIVMHALSAVEFWCQYSADYLLEKAQDLTAADRCVLSDRDVTITNGKVAEGRDRFWQLEEKLDYVYRLHTGSVLDRGSVLWQELRELKKARNLYAHHNYRRVLDQHPRRPWFEEPAAACRLASDLMTAFIENGRMFRDLYIWDFLKFWFVQIEEPILWDGDQPGSVYLGRHPHGYAQMPEAVGSMPHSFALAGFPPGT